MLHMAVLWCALQSDPEPGARGPAAQGSHPSAVAMATVASPGGKRVSDSEALRSAPVDMQIYVTKMFLGASFMTEKSWKPHGTPWND